MEICDEVTVNGRGINASNMVASDNFSQRDLVENPIENVQNRFSLFSGSKENNDNNNLPQTANGQNAEFGGESACNRENNVFESNSVMQDSSSLKMGNRALNPTHTDGNNRQDTYSIASSFSSASSSSSLSSMGLTFDTDRKLNISSTDQKLVKSFGPADDNQNNGNRNQTQAHPRIRRVPSKANPKYRVPPLNRNQRSKSQPHIQVSHLLSQRRNSSPSHLNYQNIPNVHSRMKQTSSLPNFNCRQPQPAQQQKEQQPQQSQQQIIYLEIPQPSQDQLCDLQGLQQHISSQLQLLVPKIFSELVNQMNVNSAQLNSVKVSLNQNNSNPTSVEMGCQTKDSDVESNTYLSSSFTTDGNHSQRMMNQMLQQNSLTKPASIQTPPNPQPKRPKTNQSQRQSNLQRTPSLEGLNENENINQHLNISDLNYVLQHIPPQVLQQNYSKPETSHIEIQTLSGSSKFTIPLTQELLLYCQQLQQIREPGFVPKLETILEESISVRHLKMSRFSKTKIVACVLTVLCVIAVILLAGGDKTIAVAVVAAVFILFLLGSTFYLYTHSSRSDMENSLSTSDNPRLQVSGLSNCNQSTLP